MPGWWPSTVPSRVTIAPAREPPSLWPTSRACAPEATKQISWLSGLSAVTSPSVAARDQSYVLFDVPPERLGRMLLPVGGMAKAAVRERAAALGLVTADKPDSQEIC
ncbi:MAG: hypothetical protein ACKOHG_10650, partial [Planctomycetia bacterium]